MDLRAWLKVLPDEDSRSEFAVLCGTSLGHLRNISNGKTCGPALAVAIEKQSRLQLRRWDLRPDDWWKIWPELINSEGAPSVPTAQEAA